MNLTTAQLGRAGGVLVATAAGDALGARHEFGPALPTTTPVTMKGGGLFGFAPAEWTDDTSMAITIATSIIDGLDAGHSPAAAGTLAQMVTDWQRWSAESKDVGAQTNSVLRLAGRLMSGVASADAAAFQAAREHHESSVRSAGNGSLMPTAPVTLALLNSGPSLWEASGRISSLTHFELDATEASQPRDFVLNGQVVEVLQGAWSAIHHGVAAAGSVGPKTLRLTLEGAVRGGNDADTVAAIAGGLIGAAAGYSAVSSEWRRKLHGWGADGEHELVALAM